MKKLSIYVLSLLCGLCMVFGFAFSFNTTVVNANTADGVTPTLSTTKYKISKSQEHMLLATGIKDCEDVYEIGYAFKDTEGVTKYNAVTTKYYTSITSGNSTWTVEDMFGSEYTGMIVWEVAYNQAQAYTYQAYAKVGDRVNGNLVATDTIVYGTRKDLGATTCNVTFDLNGGMVDGKSAVEDKTVVYGNAFGKLPTPIKEYSNFIEWNTKADGTGESITAETIAEMKGDVVLYAIYSNGLDFTTADQINYFSKPQTVNYSIVDNYLKVEGQYGETNILVYDAELKANSVVEIDVEYVTNNVTFVNGVNQFTFLGYTANAAGDPDGKTTAVMGNASWDGGWNGSKTTVSVAVTQDCYGVRMQFVYNADENAYYKITSIRVLEYPLIYDFANESQLSVIESQKNTTYSIVDNYLKVVGKHGSESTMLFKSTLKAGAKVEIDVEYVCANPAYSAGQVTFLAYTANAQGNNDGITTSVMGNAKWDGGWDCKKTTVSTDITQDCYGIRMQFVMNSEANAYFKITGIRVFYPEYPTVTITYDTTFATKEVAYGSAYGTLASAPQKAGYVFKGWSLNADGSGELVKASTLVKTARNHALYAVYEKAEEVVEEQERLEYDFSTSDQLDEFIELDHGGKEIVTESTGNYAKFYPTDMNNLYSIFWFKKDLKAGSVVEMDFELVGTIATNHGIWTWGANASGGAQFDGQFVTGWDAPAVWNGGKFTSTTNITSDCYGVRVQMKYGDNAQAYWKLTAIRIIEPIEYPIAYDFSDESVLDKFVELDHGGKEIVTETTGNYAKFYPTDMNNLYSIFFFKQNLKAGMTVEMDFELVGTIAANHGIWTWGANASGGAQFDGQFVTGWDAPAVWNGGKFTSTTNITADCYGVRVQMRYGDNTEAYWKLTSIRIINGEKPTSTVTYSANGQTVSSASVAFGGKYSLPSAPTKENAVFKGWYFNAEGTGVQVTSNTAMTTKGDHTVYAVYKEYYKVPNFFEENQLWNITNVENTKITHVKDASGNYLKLSPIESGDTASANNPQSYFFFEYPSLTEGMVVEMDFELVGGINVGHGVWTWGANVNKDNLFDGQFVTAWDAPQTWNNGKFTSVTRITSACAGIRVLVRYANNANAYWKLTGIRVYAREEYLDIPTYADDKHIDIGATSWLGTNQTLAYFNGDNGEANFAKLQEAGITVLAGTFYGNTGSEEDDKRLLDLAKKYGVGLFFQKNWDGSTIPSYVAHEAFLGYYVDEPKQSDLSSLKTLKEKWDASAFGANGKQLYVNLLPVYSGDMGGDYDAYVKGAIETSNLPIVSFDHYMMYYKAKKNVFNSITGYESTISLRKDWLKNFDVASYYANKNGKPFWYTLLTTQHLADGKETKYIDPTVADLTYQMYVAMTYGATNLIHYTFAGTGDYIIDGAMFNQNTGEWTQTYTDVKNASARIGKWDHVFMNFDWLGVSTVTGSVAQTGLITNDLTHSVAVNQFGVVSSVTSTQDVVVGHFKDANGYNGVMITNLTVPANKTNANVTISFNSEYKAVKVYQNGEEKLIFLNNGVLTLDIASAEGVFIIPVKEK